MSASLMPASNLLTDLTSIVGQDHVLTSDADRDFYAMDVYNQLKLPLAVIQPGSVEELQKVVRTATTAGVAVVPRGGGASYTDGYLPTVTNSILLDTGRLNRIVELNEGDMYVTVESGITWAELWQALKGRPRASLHYVVTISVDTGEPSVALPVVSQSSVGGAA